MESEKSYTREEENVLREKRAISDAELIKGGARYYEENLMPTEEQINIAKREMAHERVGIDRKEREERMANDKRLLGEINNLDIETEEGKSALEKLIKEISPEVCSTLESVIFDRVISAGQGIKPETKRILESIGKFDILTISTHKGEKSAFHLHSKEGEIRIKDGEFGYGGERYRIHDVRPGYDRNVVVIIAVPAGEKSPKGWGGRESGSLELYTDIPFYKTFATPQEYQVFFEKEPEEKIEDILEGKAARRVDDQQLFSKIVHRKALREGPQYFGE